MYIFFFKMLIFALNGLYVGILSDNSEISRLIVIYNPKIKNGIRQ